MSRWAGDVLWFGEVRVVVMGLVAEEDEEEVEVGELSPVKVKFALRSSLSFELSRLMRFSVKDVSLVVEEREEGAVSGLTSRSAPPADPAPPTGAAPAPLDEVRLTLGGGSILGATFNSSLFPLASWAGRGVMIWVSLFPLAPPPLFKSLFAENGFALKLLLLLLGLTW